MNFWRSFGPKMWRWVSMMLLVALDSDIQEYLWWKSQPDTCYELYRFAHIRQKTARDAMV
jgi:hypothetical protein